MVAMIPEQVAEKLLLVYFLRSVLKFPLENLMRAFSKTSNPNRNSHSPPKNCNIQLIIMIGGFLKTLFLALLFVQFFQWLFRK
jgi:hypothetical protein